MIVQSFKSVIWVGAVAGAALSCYMVSLRVASERAALERVENRILVAKRDIRALDTELVTRGRVRQLERWNRDVLALAAPTEGQFLQGEVQLASLTRVDPVEPAPLMLAVADADEAVSREEERPRPVLASYKPERPRLIRASAPRAELVAEKVPARSKPAASKVEPKKPKAKKAAADKPKVKRVAAKKPVAEKPIAKTAAADKRKADKPVASKPVTSKLATAKPKATKAATGKPSASKPIASKPVAKPVVKTAAVAAKKVKAKKAL